MLDYAANASANWTGETMRSWFEDEARASGKVPEDAIRATFPELDDIDDYWSRVRVNLAAERLRLVFVADAIPSELRRIIEFLNGQMTQTEVLAIEVKQYRDPSGAHETFVPTVVGRTEAAKSVKGESNRAATRTRASLLHEMTPPHAAVVQRLFEWVDRRDDLTEWFGTSRNNAYQAGYNGDRYVWPFSVSVQGWINVHAPEIARRPAFLDESTRAVVVTKLNQIPGLDVVDLSKRCKVFCDAIASPPAFEQLTNALDWIYAHAAPTRVGI